MEEAGRGAIKVMLKITEIIVAKIKIFGQDHGWILSIPPLILRAISNKIYCIVL